jgi:hypothetical protein
VEEGCKDENAQVNPPFMQTKAHGALDHVDDVPQISTSAHVMARKRTRAIEIATKSIALPEDGIEQMP